MFKYKILVFDEDKFSWKTREINQIKINKCCRNHIQVFNRTQGSDTPPYLTGLYLGAFAGEILREIWDPIS